MAETCKTSKDTGKGRTLCPKWVRDDASPQRLAQTWTKHMPDTGPVHGIEMLDLCCPISEDSAEAQEDLFRMPSMSVVHGRPKV